MAKYLPGKGAYVVAWLAAFASGIGVWLAFSLYYRHNQVHCGGAFGWLAPAFAVIGWLIFDALFTVASVLLALGTAIVRRR